MLKLALKITILLIILSVIYLIAYPLTVDVASLNKKNPQITAMMKFRIEQWKREGKKISIQMQWTPIERISTYLIKAVLIGEDDKFYKHAGFDIEAIKKAIERDIKEKRLKYGGSTITQQLAKNLYLSPSKNPIRKIQEAIITWRLERTLTKKRILELYLNIAEWGEGIFGAEAASKTHFGKSASQLSAIEAARLAAALPNPIRYSPSGNSKFIERRAALIYFIMQKRGIIKEEFTESEKNDRESPSEQSQQEIKEYSPNPQEADQSPSK